METIQAVYEKGILRPLRPLALRERQMVNLQIVPDDLPAQAEPTDETESVVRTLVAAGMIDPPITPASIPSDPVPWEERQCLAGLAGWAPGKTASEMVIEDRGER